MEDNRGGAKEANKDKTQKIGELKKIKESKRQEVKRRGRGRSTRTKRRKETYIYKTTSIKK